MKTLVTGAAGFIGSHVVRALLAEGHDVRAMVRPGENRANIKGLDVEVVEADILDLTAVRRAVDEVHWVFHLAAIFAIWMKDWQDIYEVNLQGSRNLLWSAMEAGCSRVVYTSSIAAVGVAPGKSFSTEETPFNQYGLGNHYVLTKYLSQQEALGFAANGLDLVVVNPAFPFGVMDTGPTPTGKLIVDILKGKMPVSYPGGINLIDVKDIARGHLLAAENGERGKLYILGNENITIDRFIRKVKKLAGVNDRTLPGIPWPVMKAGASVLTLWADHISHRPPITTPKEVAYSSQYLWCDNTRARKELGLTLTSVDASLTESIAWFRENGYV
ncbi:dihydroflavonol-4-reductase [Desulfoluna limicola]|uniref:Dihydroflavonol-4-reductase n=1 Tax=Desulfoluna limicola TaxID=2810562 RepID=A0ABN6F0K3_9BACT|nr:SDR family oxidoreductase [Desulfoluna limicola]BCS96079.1 dihydroflavonol-4-reductase [Desulfoluna limicola]